MEETKMEKTGRESKYQYTMSEMFGGTDGNYYDIDIPVPFLYDSEEEAMEAEEFGFRFLWLCDEPNIVIYEKENFKVNKEESGEESLNAWIEGEPLAAYTFQEFIKAGGKMRMLKPEHQGIHLEEEDFIDTDNTFFDCFPEMEHFKLYYIDAEAYFIKKLSISNAEKIVSE